MKRTAKPQRDVNYASDGRLSLSSCKPKDILIESGGGFEGRYLASFVDVALISCIFMLAHMGGGLLEPRRLQQSVIKREGETHYCSLQTSKISQVQNV